MELHTQHTNSFSDIRRLIASSKIEKTSDRVRGVVREMDVKSRTGFEFESSPKNSLASKATGIMSAKNESELVNSFKQAHDFISKSGKETILKGRTAPYLENKNLAVPSIVR